MGIRWNWLHRFRGGPLSLALVVMSVCAAEAVEAKVASGGESCARVADSFAAGTSAAKITPTRAELDEMAGRRRFTNKPPYPEGEAQPLWAKALATRAGTKTTLLLTTDLSSTPSWMSNRVRDELSRKCGLTREAIAVCNSHNHAVPGDRSEDRAYNRRVVQVLIDVGTAAVGNLRPAKIGATKGYDHSLAYNSRLPITDDVPPEACPNRDRHRGGCMFARDHCLGRSGGRPVDPEVGVIRIDDAHGKPIAVMLHYSCHPATVIEGPSLHGDYSGFAAAEIEKVCPGATAFFLQGSLGNIHPRDFFTNIENARRNGQRLAAEVLRVLTGIRTTGEVRMGFAGEQFPVTFVSYPTERLERLLRYFREFERKLATDPQACWIGAGADTVNLPPRFPADARRRMVEPLIQYCEGKLAARRRGETEALKPLDTDVQVFRWNDIALCLNGFEMFCQTGLEIKRRSPLRYTFPVGCANTCIGYVAPQEEFDLGGYEVVTHPMYGNLPGMKSPANCDRIIERFDALLHKLTEVQR